MTDRRQEVRDEATAVVRCRVCGRPLPYRFPSSLKGEFAHVRCGLPGPDAEWPDLIDREGERDA